LCELFPLSRTLTAKLIVFLYSGRIQLQIHLSYLKLTALFSILHRVWKSDQQGPF